MSITEEQIRIIFGLKLKQIRTQRGLSLFGLSKKTGLSKSYLNEIEKGKKYPKPDKVVLLAQALETSYDDFVSMKLSGTMAPLSDIIKSGILKEIPLDLFGIEESNLIDIIANAPYKVSAFITTLFEIARNYDVTRESFYLAALRSYQESKENYFEEIEESARTFFHKYQLNVNDKLSPDHLEEILIDEFGYTVDYDTLKHEQTPRKVRSLFLPKEKTLLIARNVSPTQLLFIFAKELGYCHLGITVRPLTFTWITFDSFDEVLNNFRASYFAGALLLPEERLVNDLTEFFERSTWDPKEFLKLLFSYTESAETFFHRLTNLLPKHFGLKDIFYLRFSKDPEKQRIDLTKELHLSKSHKPHAIQNNETYCRRWISTDILVREDSYEEYKGLFAGAQRSVYHGREEDYFIIAASNKDFFTANGSRSYCIGIEMIPKQRNKIAFLRDENVQKRLVSVTCERCGIQECAERVKAPTILQKIEQDKGLKQWVNTRLKMQQSKK